VKKVLANSEPSTHERTNVDMPPRHSAVDSAVVHQHSFRPAM
jgi:hypothetical protein